MLKPIKCISREKLAIVLQEDMVSLVSETSCGVLIQTSDQNAVRQYGAVARHGKGSARR